MKSFWYCKYKLAHRGLHNDIYPENSIGAFENAKEQGFAIELDVRLLKDDSVVVIHDANLKRVCGIDKDVEDLMPEDLAECKILSSKYTIPTLKQVLEIIDGKTPIMIELKPIKKEKKLAQKVYELIKDYNGDVAVKSFNPIPMIWFRRHAPKIPRGMLGSFFEGTIIPRLYKSIIKKLSFYNLVKPDFISYDVNYLPNKYLIKKKVPILAWTITNKKMEKIAFEHSNNVIFENYIPDSPINY